MAADLLVAYARDLVQSGITSLTVVSQWPAIETAAVPLWPMQVKATTCVHTVAVGGHLYLSFARFFFALNKLALTGIAAIVLYDCRYGGIAVRLSLQTFSKIDHLISFCLNDRQAARLVQQPQGGAQVSLVLPAIWHAAIESDKRAGYEGQVLEYCRHNFMFVKMNTSRMLEICMPILIKLQQLT